MDNARIDSEYLSIGANRQTDAAAWASNGIVAYGAETNIALWRPDSTSPKGVTSILSGHKKLVKAIGFLRSDEGDDAYLVSAGDDHCIRLWRIPQDANEPSVCVQTVEAHASPVNCIATIKPELSGASTSHAIFASGGADATVRVWKFDGHQIVLLQTLPLEPKYFPLALALCRLRGAKDAYALACAGTKDIIQIYAGASTSTSDGSSTLAFIRQATLYGHEGWIRSLDFSKESKAPGSDLLLASASQDKYVRIWRIRQLQYVAKRTPSSSPMFPSRPLPRRTPSNKAHRLNVEGVEFLVSFDSLLFGHDDWVYSARWHLSHTKTGPGVLQLLTASADNTAVIWDADPHAGIWVTSARLGDVSREKGATTATGSIGGFWTGLWSPSGMSVVVLGRTGSWRRWSCSVSSEAQDGSTHDTSDSHWLPEIAVTGHIRPVTGICWSKNGDYLMSTSSDQTTRLHAQWQQTHTWHEMARPQIHGYDLNCVDSLGASQFVSGADEKLMRVFKEPKAVARLLSRLGGIEEPDQADDAPDAANMPVLGLSNKAIDTLQDEPEEDDDQAGRMKSDQATALNDPDAPDPATLPQKSTLDISHPPFEDALSRHTLWPEVEKLYGHGYEISCLATSHDGRLIASACKASSLNHAVIRLFETDKWTEIRPPLQAHNLTVTRLRFSVDDRFLLSVGRDRQWAVFERHPSAAEAKHGGGDGKSDTYKLLQINPKGHTRMINDAAWAPASNAGWIFATAGRDKLVKVWSMKKAVLGGRQPPVIDLAQKILNEHPVTAVDFLMGSKLHSSDETSVLTLAVGNEIGHLGIYMLSADGTKMLGSLAVPNSLYLPKAILQLAWRPAREQNLIDDGVDLALAGEDGSLRIYKVKGI